jgi:hypothetical protein
MSHASIVDSWKNNGVNASDGVGAPTNPAGSRRLTSRAAALAAGQRAHGMTAKSKTFATEVYICCL